jgi:hypothetical protein
VVDLLYQQHMAESIILFIEDELDHFEAVREHLEPDFKCARSHGLQIEMVAEEIEDLKPVVVVLDLMLFLRTEPRKPEWRPAEGRSPCSKADSATNWHPHDQLAERTIRTKLPSWPATGFASLKGYVREYRLLPSLNWRPLRIRSENSLQMPLPNAWI